MAKWTVGDVSSSETLTGSDHLYAGHISELRDSNPHTVVVGTGVNAMFTDIALAIAEISATGGTVFIKQGTYEISTTITIPNNVTLLGEGITTILQFPATGTTLTLLTNSDTSGGNSNITIQNLKIDGNKTSRTGNSDYSMYFDGVTGLTVKDVTFVNSRWSDLYITNCTRGLIDNFYSTGARAGAVQMEVGNTNFTITNSKVVSLPYELGLFSHAFRINGEDITVDNCIAYDCGDVGFGIGTGNWAQRARRVTVSNCVAYDTRDFGFFVPYGEGVSITGCVARNKGASAFKSGAAGGGIGFQYVDGLIIDGNLCEYNYFGGIQCADQGTGHYADHLLITNNICLNNDASASGQAGIMLYANTDAYLREALVMGNTCGDTQATATQYAGIRVTTGTNNKHVFKGNYCFRNKQSGIVIGASGPSACLIDGNFCINNGQGTVGPGISIDNPQYTTISNNICYDDQSTATQYYGIQVSTGGNHLTIIGNNVSNHLREGILLTAVEYSVVSNNTVVGNGKATANTYDGIELVNCLRNVVSGNISTGASQRYGIISSGTSNYNNVSVNILNGNTTGALSLAGANNEVAGANITA